MTTRDKGITAPASGQFTNSSGTGFFVTDVPNDYTAKNAWAYNAGNVQPINLIPVTAIAPVDFTIYGQSGNAGFAATGGNVIIRPGVGSVGSASGNAILKDTAGNGGAWNTSHYTMGIYHSWFDAAGRLRTKASTPANDTDGIVAGFDYSASAVYDPPSLADGVGTTTTVAVAGAVLGDFAIASFSLDLQSITVTAWVSAANVVSVRFQNESGGVLDLGSGTLKVKVIKQ